MRSMFRKLMSSKTFKELKLCKVKVCILYLLKSCPTDGSVQPDCFNPRQYRMIHGQEERRSSDVEEDRVH